VARRIIDQDLSVRATERLVRQTVAPPVSMASARKTQESDANVRAAETKLRRQFGTQVHITYNRNARGGKIEMEFYTQADLDRLYNLLTRSN